MTEYVSGVVLGLGAVVVGLIFLRELVCWYFKFSEQTRLLKAIEAHLEVLAAQAQGVPPRPATAPGAYPGSVPARDASGRKLTFMERIG